MNYRALVSSSCLISAGLMLCGPAHAADDATAIGGPTSKVYAQDPSARCVWVGNKQMTIASAQGRGLDIEDFSEVETAAFVKAFNALPPTSNFVASKVFAAVGRDRVYVFFENGIDLCTAPFPLSPATYEELVEQARGDGT